MVLAYPPRLEWERSFAICSQRLGRIYQFRASSAAEAEQWVSGLTAAREALHRRLALQARLSRCDVLRSKLACVYESRYYQSLSGFVLMCNFIINVVSAEWMSHGPMAASVETFDRLDLFFTVYYSLELGVCLFVYWLGPFFREAWNVYDLLIVVCSWVEAYLVEKGTSADPNLSILRTVRCLRIIRLFSRMKSIRVMVQALGATLVPVLNTVVIFFVVLCLYAVLGTRLFNRQHPTHFASFTSSFLTMMQVATLDSWSGDVVRPLLRPLVQDAGEK